MSTKKNDDKAERAAFARHKSALREAMAEDKLSRATLGLGTAILENVFCASGYCGLPIAELQKKIGVRSRRTVHLALDTLVTRGYVVVEKSQGGSRRQTNHIRLADEVPAPVQNCTRAPVQNCTRAKTHTRAADCTGTHANQHTAPVQPIAPLPVQPAAPLLKEAYSRNTSNHPQDARACAREDGADAQAAAAADDDDDNLSVDQLLDQLHRAVMAGDIDGDDVREIIVDAELEVAGAACAALEREPEYLDYIRRRAEADEAVPDVRASPELGELVH